MGTILIDGRFERLSPLRKLGMLRWARLAGVILASLLLALLIGLPAGDDAAVAGDRAERSGRGIPVPVSPAGSRGSRSSDEGFRPGRRGRLHRAARPGESSSSASRGRWTSAGRALGIAAAGMAIAEWWKYGLTGKHLTAREAFQDALATGLLAVSASPMAILQPPGSWGELLLLSQTVAAIAAILYHAANAHRLASSGRHWTRGRRC